MKKRELPLWLLVLLLCFGAGFLKGYWPATHRFPFWFEPQEIEIVVADESLFPDLWKETLQKEFNFQVKLTVVKDREEFVIRTVMSPGYHLAVVPQHWIDIAAQANQMSNFEPLIESLKKKISPDFLNFRTDDLNRNLYGIPLFWTTSRLYANSDKTPQKFFLIKDWDFISWKMDQLGINPKNISAWPLWESPSPDPKIPSVIEATHIQEHESKTIFKPFEKNISSLYLFSLGTPRHSPYRKASLRLALRLTDMDLMEPVIGSMPYATTLTGLDEENLPRYKKALFIREIDLSQSQSPPHLGMDQLKALKSKVSAQ